MVGGHSLGATFLILSVLSGAAGCAASPPMASPSLQEFVEAKAGRTGLSGRVGAAEPQPPPSAPTAEAVPMASVCVRIKDGSSCSIDPAHAIPVGAQCFCAGRYRVGTAK